MTPISCPLCGAAEKDLACRDELAIADLTKVLRRQFRIALALPGCTAIRLHECGLCGLRFYRPPCPAGEAFYEALQGLDWYYLSGKPEFEVAERYIPAGSKVLEIGAGRGEFVRRLSGMSYTGLEFSRRAIGMARESGVELLPETIEAHAQHNAGAYDAVCSFQVLEHVPDVRSFLAAAAACLKPGGLLIVSVPNDEGFMGAAVNNVMNVPPHHLTRWTGRSLESAARLLGLRLVGLEREQLYGHHRRACAETIAMRALARLGGGSARTLMPFFETLPGRLIAKKLLGGLVALGLDDPCLLPLGHSITAIYSNAP